MCLMFCVVFTKIGLSGLSPDYFLGQAWSGMANVCYCHKFNDILNMKLYDIGVMKMEIIICIGKAIP